MEYELQPRAPPSSVPSPDEFMLSDDDDDGDDAAADERGLLAGSSADFRERKRQPAAAWWRRLSRRRLRRKRLCCQLLVVLGGVLLFLAVVNALFWPSYTPTSYPSEWRALEESVSAGGGLNPADYWSEGGKKRTVSGRGNPSNERIFIAANIVDAQLIRSEWGVRVLELLDLLGEENVFLSVFENDSGPEATAALQELDETIKRYMPKAGRSIVSTTLPLEGVPHLRVPTGETYVKRIRYLAEVRNRALLPLLGSIPSLSRWNQTGIRPAPPEELSQWEFLPPIPTTAHAPILPPSWVPRPEGVAKILFLNDVVFSPLELLHLLFSTNGGDYAAACGVDFINPVKMYDTFATRDIDGWQLGLPFFPFFATAPSRRLVSLGSSAIPVKSCWGGVVAFDASYFTRRADADADAVRFRAEKEPFWDASECCLVHADIDRPQTTFVNPFVRVAYDRATFDWLPAVKRVERLFAPVQKLVTWAVGMPWGGSRRTEKGGDVVDGRAAGKGGFCGSPKLLVMNEHAKKSERKWRSVPVPA